MTTNLRDRMLAGDILAGTFMKTPAFQLVEVLALSGMDFLCLDAEHAPFDRGDADACLGMARALGLPTLVRVPDGADSTILIALDAGATGVIVPHVYSVDKAESIARASRFGHGGRGYAGSHRWAGYATRSMADVMAQSKSETIVIGQIEEPEAVEAIDDIAAVDGLDGLFVGPADLAVGYGLTDPAAPQVRDAIGKVGAAAKKHGKCCITFAPNASWVPDLQALGVTMFFIGSEQGFMLSAARDMVAGVKNAASS